MQDLRAQVGGQGRAACEPSRIEIIRAKNAMLRVLADDKPHETGRLVWALLEEEGLASGKDPDVTFDAVAYHARCRALTWPAVRDRADGLNDLAKRGIS